MTMSFKYKNFRLSTDVEENKDSSSREILPPLSPFLLSSSTHFEFVDAVPLSSCCAEETGQTDTGRAARRERRVVCWCSKKKHHQKIIPCCKTEKWTHAAKLRSGQIMQPAAISWQKNVPLWRKLHNSKCQNQLKNISSGRRSIQAVETMPRNTKKLDDERGCGYCGDCYYSSFYDDENYSCNAQRTKKEDNYVIDPDNPFNGWGETNCWYSCSSCCSKDEQET